MTIITEHIQPLLETKRIPAALVAAFCCRQHRFKTAQSGHPWERFCGKNVRMSEATRPRLTRKSRLFILSNVIGNLLGIAILFLLRRFVPHWEAWGLTLGIVLVAGIMLLARRGREILEQERFEQDMK